MASITTGSIDVTPTHAALFPSEFEDGQILVLGDEDGLTNMGAEPSSAVKGVDCDMPTDAFPHIDCPPWYVGECGHAFLGDSRLLLAGAEADDTGRRKCLTCSLSGPSFTEVDNMILEDSQAGPGDRGSGCLTLCTLGTGEVLSLDGRMDQQHTRFERYQPLTASWQPVAKPRRPYPNSEQRPHGHLVNTGDVFIPFPISSGHYSTKLNPWTRATVDDLPLPNQGYWPGDFPSVLLPLVPGDGYTPRILFCGQQPSQMLDFQYPAYGWQTVPRTAIERRPQCCATLLPTGQILLTGGITGIGLQPEFYQPSLDAARRLYNFGSGSWKTLQGAAPSPCNYPSVALLMPDGRVWAAGGDASQPEIEIYDPPYPTGPRPSIQSSPRFVGHGETFTVEATPADSIENIVLMRCGSCSRGFNPDQRSIWLQFERTGSSLKVTSPPNRNIAPPGNYMVFVIDKSGRPCEKATFVRVGVSVSVFATRDTITDSEARPVNGTSPPPPLPEAFNVVLDHVSTSDLRSSDRPFPPEIVLRFSDDNTVVPGLKAKFARTQLESTTAGPHIAQRVTLQFDLALSNTGAFDHVAPGHPRQIRIDVAWGGSKASAHFNLLKSPGVYMVTGPSLGAALDLRVMRLPRGQAYATVTNDDPIKFIQQAISVFRAHEPQNHPLDQIGADSTVELAATVGGVEINNFAFARVRFRAPAGVRANDIKVFFRLFNPSCAGMLHDSKAGYARLGDGPGAAATIGQVNGEVLSMPFFADRRGNNPKHNVDSTNVTTLVGQGVDQEVSTYFGCWLDFNVNATVRDAIIRSSHQCLVAEVHYTPDPIPRGASPLADTRLAQRNLSIVASDNPGSPAAHTVSLPIELSPESLDSVPLAAPSPKEVLSSGISKVDELCINWHNLPKDAYATLYFPSLDVSAMLNTAAALRSGSGFISLIDKHTVHFRIGQVSYLPLIWPSADPVAGLLTVQMPPTVRNGSTYQATVYQISGRQGKVIGSFELKIPVRNAENLVDQAGRELGVVQQLTMKSQKNKRWANISSKYVDILQDRVRAFGGEPEPYRGLLIPITAVSNGKLLFARYNRRRNLLEGHEMAAQGDTVPRPRQFNHNGGLITLHHFRPRVGLQLKATEFVLEHVSTEGNFDARLKKLRTDSQWPTGFRSAIKEFSDAQSVSKTAENGLHLGMQMGEAAFQVPSRLLTSSGETWLGPLPRALYTPTKEKPFRGIWVAQFQTGSEFVLLSQPEDPKTGDESDIYKGPLWAIKLSGESEDPGKLVWYASDISKPVPCQTSFDHIFKAARIVKCQGQSGSANVANPTWVDAQLYIISDDLMAIWWSNSGDIHYYHRVDITWFLG